MDQVKSTLSLENSSPKSQSKLLYEGSAWDFETIEKTWDEIERIGSKYKYDYYAPQIEVISSEQMLDVYSTIGMPVSYPHWSIGKTFLEYQEEYKKGRANLAYELVINSNPCIAYLMEENSMTMQALVMAHALVGHNSFFKCNYLFKEWTEADSIIDYLVYAKKFIMECEERYGLDRVESLLDACHALTSHGVDKYKRPPKLSPEKEKQRREEAEQIRQSLINELWRTIPGFLDQKEKELGGFKFPKEPQENILYFVQKHSPILEDWEREIVRIVRKTAQYFYPQSQTKIMNEGWATYTHYTILHDLYEEGLINAAAMEELYISHNNVITQLPYHNKYYHGLNPYAIGFAMFKDIKRICQNPTDEDKRWFPDFAGTPVLETMDYAMRNFRDESFIRQFLSPKVIRDFRLFTVHDDAEESEFYEIADIHDDIGYKTVVEDFANYNTLNLQMPQIEIVDVDIKDTREMTLVHHIQNYIPLEKNNTERTLEKLAELWGFPVNLECLDDDGREMEKFRAERKYDKTKR